MKFFWLFLFFLSSASGQQGSVQPTESLPLWEYGVGVGSAQLAEYPASDEYKTWTLPFPTFQYRGEILRADDREGARAYLLRKKNWSLEMGGGGLTSLKADDNKAREGMDDIPWGIQLGPQLVSHFSENYQVRVGVYQAINTDFRFTKFNGFVSELKLIFLFYNKLSDYLGIGKSRGRLTFAVDAASEEFMQTYFGVSKNEARSHRPEYHARSGLLSYEAGYTQSLSINRWGFYVGLTRIQYEISANRTSPLHKADHNHRAFVGISYVLGVSERKSIPEESAEGALQKMKHRMEQMQSP